MHNEYRMLEVEEAVARFLSHCKPLEPERAPALEVLDCVLAGSAIKVVVLDWPER